MAVLAILLLVGGGICSGIIAGILGIGGGVLLVPLLVSAGLTPVEAVATSSLAILMTAISGSLQNWRIGALDLRKVIALALPALVTAQIGAELADKIPPHLLLIGFALLLLVNVYLIALKKQAISQALNREITTSQENDTTSQESGTISQDKSDTPVVARDAGQTKNLALGRLATGGTAGLLAGLFGVGGGVIMVPLQILLLGEAIKPAIRTSLGAIVLTAISASFAHARLGNVVWLAGVAVGLGGLMGAQLGTRFLPKLPDEIVSLAFRALMAILAVYTFWKAWQVFQAG
ncbi:sulfite exporter TauE/SafE family protein [Synechococcus sp. PCC 7336]|uniref:sulfite exporter TauE/SafE family protein n=1 Tax=Synechococcus sp. PCC 7336 TaxID=195250 RepID=UPI00036F392B|nr:sulfite exporter TauE/SafE family protein [Synechococcus sp. PCC 7336]